MRIQLSIICNLLLLFYSCAPEPDDKVYFNKIQVENTSSQSIEIKAYDHYDSSFNTNIIPPELKESIIIASNGTSPVVICETRFGPINNSTFFPKSGADSIVLKFENNRKYISFSKNSGINNEYWIPNKSSLLNIFEKDVRKEGDVYIYTITQEDYENAHVLP